MKNKLALLLLGLLGLAGCKDSEYLVEYGCPYADYKISGKVVDTKGVPIPGIAVGRSEHSIAAHTDGQGNYTLSGEGFWERSLTFTDIDGALNGGEFAPKTVEVGMTQADNVKPGDGWYEGEYAKIVNVVLDKKQ